MGESMQIEAGAVRTPAISLSDKFTVRSGTVLISGVQALVRLMLLQAERDAAAGLKTGGYVSGYRGSPLGTLDMAFERAGKIIPDHGIVVRPGVNEELAATTVAGTQQILHTTGARVDGIFALWYGKGPGFDRAADAIRHANFSGSSAHGGVVLAVGDDHMAKSSSIICNSDEIVASVQVPLFYPADPGEIVEYGLHGFAMSRHTGSYVALKIIADVADSTRAIGMDEFVTPVLPDVAGPETGLHNHIRWPEMPLEQEGRLVNYRLPAVASYVRANRLDKIVLKKANAKIGLIAAGKPWVDLQEGLRLVGLDEAQMIALGIALYKPALIWPLEALGLREFVESLETLIIVEEKGDFIERQVKSILYGTDQTPAVHGKHRTDGTALLPATGELTPEMIGASIGELISDLTGSEAFAGKVARLRVALETLSSSATLSAVRKPFFCSGCPHNRSTIVPEGSRAIAGTGCHGLAAYNSPQTSSFAQMGGEGMHWVGLAPFTDEKHVFANMGDGTYFHSGYLAIRQAVAAGTNMTFKLLYNSAVAMTGGQSVDGELSVERMVDQLRAEGVGAVLLTTDDLDRYPAGHPIRGKVERVVHRDDLETLQRELRDRDGVTVIVHEQMCATEKRRLRKRGKLVDPSARLFINELVCEGCGDCSIKSNCLSVEPVETAFGTKRRINQSSCNKDYSCLNGFCPSFVTVEGGKLKRTKAAAEAGFDPAQLPPPDRLASTHDRVVVAGVGGTGVVTIGALLSMAAHMGGRNAAVLDQVGMAQKGGAVISHLHIADEPITALRVPSGEADLILVCDEVVGNMRDAMAMIHPGRTQIVANADVAITGDFTRDRNAQPDASLLARRLEQRAGSDHFVAYPFSSLSENLLGDAIGSNLMIVGYAWQKGLIGIELAAIEAAVDLNGTAVGMNKSALAWGRRLAVDPDAVFAAANISRETETVDVVSTRAAFLADYQHKAYADRFRTLVERVAAAEARCCGDGVLADTIAKGLFRVMAYKDEYEVARLYTNGQFEREIAQAFEGDVKLTFHLAAPLLAKRDKATGHLRKRAYGSWTMWLFRLLAKARGLRGTAFDPFGRTAERRAERQLITDYEGLVERLLAGLSADTLANAVEIAGMVLEVRGYGHVKEEAMASYRALLPAAMARYGLPAAEHDPRLRA